MYLSILPPSSIFATNSSMSLTKSDLLFDFPPELIATEPQYPPRVLFKSPFHGPQEIGFQHIINLFEPNDLLIINKTKVLPRRVFTPENIELMFLDSPDQIHWSVLFPAKKFKIGDKISLPEGLSVELIEKGIPQKVKTNAPLTSNYFEVYGQFALPPYIQNARGDARSHENDKTWYQTVWAEVPGSLAAPTASLHFKHHDIDQLKQKIDIAEVTLHVGLGTFLPITAENLTEHQMHKEYVHIEKTVVQKIQNCLNKKGRVWALGTTSLRSIEAWARGHLTEYDTFFAGQTDLFLKPGDEFKVCRGLMTNFHQPASTLIALVAAFSSLDNVKQSYKYAIDNKFRLFSYGDLSIWLRP